MSQHNYLTAKEVAELLGKCSKFVYQNQAHIPGRFKINKCILWDREVLVASLKELASRPAKEKAHVSRKDRHRLLS